MGSIVKKSIGYYTGPDETPNSILSELLRLIKAFADHFMGMRVLMDSKGPESTAQLCSRFRAFSVHSLLFCLTWAFSVCTVRYQIYFLVLLENDTRFEYQSDNFVSISSN